MNADKTVKALQFAAGMIDDPGDNVVLKTIKNHMTSAVDLIQSQTAKIESLEAQLATKTHRQAYKTCIVFDSICQITTFGVRVDDRYYFDECLLSHLDQVVGVLVADGKVKIYSLNGIAYLCGFDAAI